MRKLVKDIPKEELQALFDSTNSLSAILRSVKLSETCPHNRKLLKQRLANELDRTKHDYNKSTTNPFHNGLDHKLDDDDYFCIGDKRRSGTHIRIRLLKYKNWKDECSECKLPPTWNGKPLSLTVDHINGTPFDNTITNLRFLCPNCHSQTDTFGSKNVKK